MSALVTLLLFWGVIIAGMITAKKGKAIDLRPIAGYEALEECVGRAVEMGKPIHACPGFFGLTLEMMAGISALNHVAKLAARYDADLITTTANPDTYTVTDAVVRQAYTEAGKTDNYKPEMVRYLSNDQFAFASGVMGIISREQVASNIMIGQFAAESLLFAETGYTAGAMQIAGTARTAQLPFFVATCDYVIIGEELFAANAYFSSDNKVELGCLRGQDVAKAISISLILLGVIGQIFNNNALSALLKK